MKRHFFNSLAGALFGALGLVLVACGEPVESLLPRPAEQTQETATTETGTIVSESQAVNVAEAFFLGQKGEGVKTRSAAELKSPSSVKSIRADTGESAIHVLNYPGGGFALVSATRDYFPVLAWSDDGSFELTPDMGPVQIWIDETKEAIRVAESLDAETKAAIRAEWRRVEPATIASLPSSKTRAGYYNAQMEGAMGTRMFQLWSQYGAAGWNMSIPLSEARDVLGDTEWNRLCSQASSYGSPPEYTLVMIRDEYVHNSVGPLISTEWHQEYPYNALCNGKYAGCVTISLAQIMNFFGKPTYSHGHSWDWNSIRTSSTTGNYSELSFLIRTIGTELGINYVLGNSGATDRNTRNAFDAFNYTYINEDHNHITVRDWLVNERKPVSMGGYPNTTLGIPSGVGHQWVCDGIRSDAYGLSYYIEFISPYNYTYSNHGYSVSNPHAVPGLLTLYYHNNWGWDRVAPSWYHDSSTSTIANVNFKYGRTNFYAKPR